VATEPDTDNAASAEFLAVLEDGVKKVLSNKRSTPSERMAAVNAGVKLLAIRHKISGGDDEGFFK